MSLINEALKKAQRQRNLEATPLASAPSGIAAAAVTTHVRTASHRGSIPPVWIGLGLLLLGAGVAAVIFIFLLNPAASPTPALASTAKPAMLPAPAAPASPAPTPSAPAITPPRPETPPFFTVTAPVATPTPVQPAPVPPPAPVVRLPASVAPVPTPSRAVPPPAAAPVPVVRVTITQEARVYAVLDGLRITGVRGLGLEARVLMNEKIYRINDLVDRELSLRLSEVLPGLLVFTDATGGTYKKPL